MVIVVFVDMQFVGNASNEESKGLEDMASLTKLRASGAKVVLFFWAAWHEPSKSRVCPLQRCVGHCMRWREKSASESLLTGRCRK